MAAGDETTERRDPNVSASVQPDIFSGWAELDEGTRTFRRGTATFRQNGLVTRLRYRVKDRRVILVEETTTPDEGSEGAVADVVPIRRYLEMALFMVTLTPTDEGTWTAGDSHADRQARHEAVHHAVRRRKNDADLQDVADAYRADGADGVRKVANVSERQAYRLITAARAAGLLPKGRGKR